MHFLEKYTDFFFRTIRIRNNAVLVKNRAETLVFPKDICYTVVNGATEERKIT